MTTTLAAPEAGPAEPAGFIEKRPLERYRPPARPSLVGLSREVMTAALGGIGVPERQRRMRVRRSGTGSMSAARNSSTR